MSPILYIQSKPRIHPLIPFLDTATSDNWNPKDYIYHLNSKVFFWPTIKRLKTHYNRYKNENPTIIRCRTEDLLKINDTVEYCRLNSGATRPNPFLRRASLRGPNTFVTIDQFQYGIGEVAEVTFPDKCILPEKIWLSKNPNGDWEEVVL